MGDACLVDGTPNTTLPTDDRGLAYGDGIFRTLRVESGAVVAWQAHMSRLAHDCDALELDRPDPRTLRADAARLFVDGGSGVLKIMITRGSGGRGYAPPDRGSRRIVSRHALPPHAGDTPAPLELERADLVLGEQPRLGGVKHLNRLEQVLARAECARRGLADAYLCTADGSIVATTMRNLLFRDETGRWLTPRLSRAGVAGATRARLMHALQVAGTPVIETEIGMDDMAGMHAVIACNSVGGVVAVTRMGDLQPRDSTSAAADCRRLIETDEKPVPLTGDSTGE